ncbi:GNAT family N-acetyltransferase [Spongiimicrobium sp. 3-5]|uniref:GNAT family N-acetyltransferase n=1 Tax=Spongiimicrobium sp. 3-5 TaxID=3332596 RepID=UPI003981897B
MNTYTVKTDALTATDYQGLRNTTGWHPITDSGVEKALARDLFSVCVYCDGKTVGMGRIIGDGAIYFYIQDVIVHPEHKGQGVGTLIMDAVEKFLSDAVTEYAFIGLMAAQDVAEFYNRFGYRKRPDHGPGMYKVITR